MSKLIKFLIISFLFLFTACSTSNHVVSNSFIQKRKYTKGYHVQLKAQENTEKTKTALFPIEKTPFETSSNQLIKQEKKSNQINPVISFVKQEKLKIHRAENKESLKERELVIFENESNQLSAPELFLSGKEEGEESNSAKEIENFSLASFLLLIASILLSLFTFVPVWVLTLTLSFLFGIVGIIRFMKRPNDFKGKWMAIASLSIIFYLLLYIVKSELLNIY